MTTPSRILQLFRPQPDTIALAAFLFIVMPFADDVIRERASNVQVCGGLFGWISCWRWIRTGTPGGLPTGNIVADHPWTFLILYPLICYVLSVISVAVVRHLFQRWVSSNNLP